MINAIKKTKYTTMYPMAQVRNTEIIPDSLLCPVHQSPNSIDS